MRGCVGMSITGLPINTRLDGIVRSRRRTAMKKSNSSAHPLLASIRPTYITYGSVETELLSARAASTAVRNLGADADDDARHVRVGGDRLNQRLFLVTSCT